MKYLIAILLFIFLFVALFIVGNFLVEYIKINEEIKNENWSLKQDNRQIKQLLGACVEELKKYKKECEIEERKPFNQKTFILPKRPINRIIRNRTINWNYVR